MAVRQCLPRGDTGGALPDRPRHNGARGTAAPRRFAGAIFDVDGVLVDSPHQRAWREALRELMDGDWRAIAPATRYRPGRFTAALYQRLLAGRPRREGAQAALDYFGVPEAAARAQEYADRKQRHLAAQIAAGAFAPFADGIRFARGLKVRGLRLAAASSSKNARALLRAIPLVPTDSGTARGATLLDLFDADVCGRDLPRGKPDPAIFLAAARELGLPPVACLVVEDAPAGIAAARAGGMAALAVARLGDEAELAAAGADLVVPTLDDVALGSLLAGRLERRDTTLLVPGEEAGAAAVAGAASSAVQPDGGERDVGSDA